NFPNDWVLLSTAGPDTAEMRIQFRLQSATAPTTFDSSRYAALESETNYDLMEDEAVSEDPAARMFQKWEKRKK
ncbi:unnamed protein product, partial [Rotaria sp. Silwood2]